MNYDPQCFNDIVFGSQQGKHLLRAIIDRKLPFPVAGKSGILLYGAVGTGKSALAKILPKEIERNRSGIDPEVTLKRISKGNDGAELMKRIIDETQLIPIGSYHRYFVLDEVDLLMADAMKSLKTAMNYEGPVFIMTTNHLQKVEIGVRNRCHIIEFNAAAADDWLPLVRRIIADHNVVCPDDSLLLPLIAHQRGSARDIITAAHMLALQLPAKPLPQPATAMS